MNLSTAVAIIAIASTVSPAVVSAGKAGKHHAPNTKTAKVPKAAKAFNSFSYSMSYPEEPTCPCFDGEDLLAITAANVSEDEESCTPIFGPTEISFSVFNQDGSALFETRSVPIFGPDGVPEDVEFLCTANDQEKSVSFLEYDVCGRLIESRCAVVKPPACPCFDEEDLLAVTAENVAEGACKEILSDGSDTFVLFNEDDSASFTFIRNFPTPTSDFSFQCSGRDNNSGLNTEETFTNVLDSQVCDDLIVEHCADIGQPVVPVPV